MTETRFYEAARLSSPSKSLFSLTPLDKLRSSFKYTLELKLVSNFDAQSIRKHMWHMIFLTFSHNWCFKNSMYLFTGLSIMTVRIFIEILKKEWYVNSLFSSDFQWLLQIPAGDLCRRKIVFSYHLHQQTLRFQHQLSVCPFHLSLLSCFEIWG